MNFPNSITEPITRVSVGAYEKNSISPWIENQPAIAQRKNETRYNPPFSVAATAGEFFSMGRKSPSMMFGLSNVRAALLDCDATAGTVEAAARGAATGDTRTSSWRRLFAMYLSRIILPLSIILLHRVTTGETQ